MKTNIEKRPSVAVLNSLFTYDPETGELRRKKNGRLAGSEDGRGYRQLMVKGWRGRVHQIAFAMHTGEWASSFVDHINGDKSDNRAKNLRAATPAENSANLIKKGSVQYDTSGYRAHITHKGRRYTFTRCDTEEQAKAFYGFADVLFNKDFAHVDSKSMVLKALHDSLTHVE